MRKLESIMLIDDDSNANFYNKYILSELNPDINIIEFTSGQDALDYLYADNNPTDIILLDINMPLMNGWQFLEKYNNLPKEQISQTIVVMLTSSINPEDKRRVVNYPFVKQFFNKPLDFETLKEVLDLYHHFSDSENMTEKESFEYLEDENIIKASYIGVVNKDDEIKFISKAAKFSSKVQCNYILFDMTRVVENFGLYEAYELNKNFLTLTGLTFRHHCAFVFSQEDDVKSKLEFKESVAKNWGQDIFKIFTNYNNAMKWLLEKKSDSDVISS